MDAVARREELTANEDVEQVLLRSNDDIERGTSHLPGVPFVNPEPSYAVKFSYPRVPSALPTCPTFSAPECRDQRTICRGPPATFPGACSNACGHVARARGAPRSEAPAALGSPRGATCGCGPAGASARARTVVRVWLQGSPLDAHRRRVALLRSDTAGPCRTRSPRFTARVRNECLNATWFWTRAEARSTMRSCGSSATRRGLTAASPACPPTVFAREHEQVDPAAGTQRREQRCGARHARHPRGSTSRADCRRRQGDGTIKRRAQAPQ
jgi:hypothetical protein